MLFLCHQLIFCLVELWLKFCAKTKRDFQTQMENVAYTDQALCDNIFPPPHRTCLSWDGLS
jgi:hypothetical protein